MPVSCVTGEQCACFPGSMRCAEKKLNSSKIPTASLLWKIYWLSTRALPDQILSLPKRFFLKPKALIRNCRPQRTRAWCWSFYWRLFRLERFQTIKFYGGAIAGGGLPIMRKKREEIIKFSKKIYYTFHLKKKK